MNITRSDRSRIALWWWTIDRYLLTSFLILMMFGIFLVMASSQHLAQNLIPHIILLLGTYYLVH